MTGARIFRSSIRNGARHEVHAARITASFYHGCKRAARTFVSPPMRNVVLGLSLPLLIVFALVGCSSHPPPPPIVPDSDPQPQLVDDGQAPIARDPDQRADEVPRS